MKLISWNVNGLRAIMKNGFTDFVKKEKPDVLCLQEVKAENNQIDFGLEGNNIFPEYNIFWNSAKKKGYSGTVVFSKIKPLKITNGIGKKIHDSEGRVITLEFSKYFLVNVYAPNSQRGLTRLDYRIQWDKDFLKYLKKLEKKKPVVFCGDLNVSHKEIDLANPKANKRNAGFTNEERGGFSKLVDSGFIDTFRELHKEGNNYTWWTYRFNARKRNIGWRIDYFCVSPKLMKKVKDSFILSKILGSDHCPIGLILD